jgi:hypothetical protein
MLGLSARDRDVVVLRPVPKHGESRHDGRDREPSDKD